MLQKTPYSHPGMLKSSSAVEWVWNVVPLEDY